MFNAVTLLSTDLVSGRTAISIDWSLGRHRPSTACGWHEFKMCLEMGEVIRTADSGEQPRAPDGLVQQDNSQRQEVHRTLRAGNEHNSIRAPGTQSFRKLVYTCARRCLAGTCDQELLWRIDANTASPHCTRRRCLPCGSPRFYSIHVSSIPACIRRLVGWLPEHDRSIVCVQYHQTQRLQATRRTSHAYYEAMDPTPQTVPPFQRTAEAQDRAVCACSLHRPNHIRPANARTRQRPSYQPLRALQA